MGKNKTVNGVRACSLCKEEQELSNFYKKGDGCYSAYCKICNNKKIREWRRKNKKIVNEQNKRQREKRVLLGGCNNCARKREDLSKKFCNLCLEKRKERSIISKTLNICITCNNKPKSYKNSKCVECILNNFIYMLKIKNLVFSHYGGYKCVCCGITNYLVLTIDHIYGGGTEHQKETNRQLYFWLFKNNYPDGFQVLCANCNWKKHVETRKRGNKYYNKRKQKVFDYYGNKCVKCGCEDKDVLCIDHVNEDGYKFRDKKTKNSGGCDIYHFILKNNFPSDLQILCRNCNMEKYMTFKYSWLRAFDYVI